MERRLGRGLGSLLSGELSPGEERSEIPVSKIRPNPFQPRRTFSSDALKELETSIRAHGVLQPILLRPTESGYDLIAGERRWRAAQAAGLKTIPAVLREGITDQAMLELALIENLQRADLDAIEKAKGFRQLLDGGLTQDQIAAKMGLQRSTVSNFLRLLELSDSVQKVVSDGLLSMGHARALLGLADQHRQEELCAQIVRRGLSVRDVEQRVRELQGRTIGDRKVVSPSPPPWVRDMEARMRAHLGTKVQIQNGEGYQGRIVVDYHGREDLDRLYVLLAPKKSL